MSNHQEDRELFGTIFSRCHCGACNQERAEICADCVKPEEVLPRIEELEELRVGLIDYLSKLEAELRCRLRIH